VNEQDSQGSSDIYWGLLRAQGLAILAVVLMVSVIRGPADLLLAGWGGAISLIAYAWAGFQLWMHPGNREPARQTGAPIRAEVGKVVVILALFGWTFSQWPDVGESSALIILAGAFLWTYLCGLVWLHWWTTREPQDR
jgi:ATP synthase protein I